MLLVGAVANFFWGLAALDSKAYLDESGLLYGTLETWGWIAVGGSALLAIGGILLLARTGVGPSSESSSRPSAASSGCSRCP